MRITSQLLFLSGLVSWDPPHVYVFNYFTWRYLLVGLPMVRSRSSTFSKPLLVQPLRSMTSCLLGLFHFLRQKKTKGRELGQGIDCGRHPQRSQGERITGSKLRNFHHYKEVNLVPLFITG